MVFSYFRVFFTDQIQMDPSNLSKSEYARYHRHLIMPEFNLDAQLKLKQASVLVIGAGGLGAPLLQYLAAAGIGHIGIADFDKIELSNLQRQVLFTTKDIGRYKAEVAKEKILALNSNITVTLHLEKLDQKNALGILASYDIVADGTDNFPTRYLINDASFLLKKANVFGSIFRFEGQVAVFNYLEENGSRSCNYRDLFPEPPAPGTVPNCAEAGVLGVLPGIIGAMQANEVIKVITGIGAPLVNKIFILDTLTFSNHTLKIKRRKDNPLSGESPTIKELIDYEVFCGIESSDKSINIKSITAQELNKWESEKVDFQLIDVRESSEYELFNINGILMPLSNIENYVDKINRAKKVVIHCQTGKRSLKAISLLQEKYGFGNLYNLEGGVNKI